MPVRDLGRQVGMWRRCVSCRVVAGFGTWVCGTVCGTRSGKLVSREILGWVWWCGMRLHPQTPETAKDFEFFGVASKDQSVITLGLGLVPSFLIPLNHRTEAPEKGKN